MGLLETIAGRAISVLLGSGLLFVLVRLALKGFFSGYYTKAEVDDGREKVIGNMLLNYYTKKEVEDRFVECKFCNERHGK